MCCEICLNDSAVDSAMWNCVGCSRSFHAACVGIPATRSSLRKKEKKIEVQDFVLPCCSSCQNLISLNFDFHLLVEQQQKLADNINSNTQVLHKANKEDKMDLVHEAIDRVEGLLLANKKEVKAGIDTVDLKNHLTSLLNISMGATRKRIDEYVEDLTGDLTRELKTICAEVEKLSSLVIDTASHCAEHNNAPKPTHEIIEEIKLLASSVKCDISTQINTVASAVNSIETSLTNKLSNAQCVPRLPPPTSPPSLMDELESQPTVVSDLDTAGWRVLDNERVWKADWTQYDARKSVREKQQKMADKAKKRKIRNKAKAMKNRGQKNTNNTRWHINFDHNFPNNFDRSSRFPNQCHQQMQRTRWHTNFDKNVPNNSDRSSRFPTQCNNRNNLLPPDRELLAEAKYRFSRPPTNLPFVQFQKGEILNPYPVSDGHMHQVPNAANRVVPARPSTSGSCGACACACTNHKCF